MRSAMPTISIAQHYHERTKYAPDTIATKSQGLDWSKQPSPYKVYQVGTIYDLKSYLTEEAEPLSSDRLISQWQRLSRLLLCSYGLTARMDTYGGEPLYLRAAPSAGGLYPAELYLIASDSSFLAAGLYNYQPQTHSLIHFWQSDQAWQSLQTACFDNSALEITDLAIVTTAIFYRSAWRYQDRAYRRIFLDTGHLLGNIELSSAINHYRPYLIGGFEDQALNELMFLDASEEGAIAVIPLLDLAGSEFSHTQAITALASKINTDYPRLADGQLLAYLHESSQIKRSDFKNQNLSPAQERADKYNFPFCTKVSTLTAPINWGADLEELESTILRRRSTRAYSGAALSLEELKAILDFTYQPDHYQNQGLDRSPDYFDLSLIETFIAVSAVTGLEEGCYYYAPKTQELRQIRFKNFRQELHFLCLGQELGRDAGALVFHTADLEKAVAKYGDRVYRYLHMDAGHLGQRLNLAAIHLGLGVSGIGGFFDNQVNEVLGIPNDEAVLYINTLGYGV